MKYLKNPKLIGTLIAVFWFAIGTYAFSWPPVGCTPESCPNWPFAFLSSDNIKIGVTIAGVTGNLEEKIDVDGDGVIYGVDYDDTDPNIFFENLTTDNIKKWISVNGLLGTLELKPGNATAIYSPATFSEAFSTCSNLETDGLTDWHLPDASEASTKIGIIEGWPVLWVNAWGSSECIKRSGENRWDTYDRQGWDSSQGVMVSIQYKGNCYNWVCSSCGYVDMQQRSFQCVR